MFLSEERRGAVAICTLERPEVLNALSRGLMEELVTRLRTLEADDAVRVIVLTGAGRAFAAGADIEELLTKTPFAMVEERYLDYWDAVRGLSKPLLAAVHGYCLGGGLELAMSADIILASESAQFGQPEIRIGVMPGAGGTQLLPRFLGLGRALECIWTGRMLSAREAERYGLVTRVVADGVLLDEALRLAEAIAQMPPLAVRMAKAAVRRSFLAGTDFGFERQGFALLFTTDDQKEGMRAFLEKRTPEFRGS